MTRVLWVLLAALAPLVALEAAAETDAPPPPEPRWMAHPLGYEPPPEVKKFYRAKCQVCHGASGAGDGPGARPLNPKPGDFRDPKWQKAVTDARIEKATVDGGAAVGKSPTMPGAPELKRKKEVASGLVQLVRSFGK